MSRERFSSTRECNVGLQYTPLPTFSRLEHCSDNCVLQILVTGTGMTAFRGKQTLQTMCFFKLINELEDFTPDTIFAQLPPTLRRMLLLKLPVVDVIKLESTNVVRGIDMNIVWEELCNQRLHHPLMLTDYHFNGSNLHYRGSWKEHYLAIVTSILLNVFKAEHELYYHCAQCAFSLLFSYCNFCTFAMPMPDFPHPEYLLLLPDRYVELQDMIDTPSSFASFLMKECRYWPKVVYISCSLFFYSPFWKERNSLEVSSTLSDFLSDARQIVFSSDNEVMKYWNPDDERQWYNRDRFHMVSRYMMEMILSSDNPHLESMLTDNNCSIVLAGHIISIVCDLLTMCESDYEKYSQFIPFHMSIPKKNLLKNVPYKHLKRISLSTDTSDPLEQLDNHTALRLASAIETQTSLETVQLSGWPCDKHFTNTDWYDGEQEFTHLFSVLASLFKQPQFQTLELEVTSVLFSSLQEILHSFFTAMSPNHQTLKLGSIAIFQKSMMPGAFVVPSFNEMLFDKSLHLSNMELTPSQETLIFSYPLLKLETLALINLTSVSPSKSLGKAADLLHVNEISNLKTLILKDIVLHHPSPQSIISLLLQSPNLTHLEMEHCDIGPDGLVTSLSREISSHSDMCVLKLVRNELGRESEHNFQQLCNAIFSLPHVSNLSLDVSANELAVHHFTILLDTWKQSCSGRKLKKLVVSGNDLKPGLLALANIAHHVVF